MSDDAYITLRTIDNFVNGLGLSWNINERVQNFTHPLWLFLITLPYAFSHEPYFTTLFMAILVTLVTCGILFWVILKAEHKVITGFLILILSNAFIDFSTSGLENPLSHLLLVIFCLLLIHAPKTNRHIFWMSFVASLAGLTRMDTLLFYFPALVWVWWQAEDTKWKTLLVGVLGQLPLLCWEIFSLIYYGFPFPNTYYAKLNTGLPAHEIYRSGLDYYFSSLQLDPLTLIIIVSSILIAFVSTRNRNKTYPLAIGVLLYLVYIFRIGGDFMSGRFFTMPLVAAVILFSLALPGKLSKNKPAYALIWVSVLVLGLTAPKPTYDITVDQEAVKEQAESGKIISEREYYFAQTGLVNQIRTEDAPYFEWRYMGESYRWEAQNNPDFKVARAQTIGMIGYYAGPEIHFYDRVGLADPLLARLPAEFNPYWRVGHLDRSRVLIELEGYNDTVLTGENQLTDSNLRTYYDYLALITRGRIFSGERFRAIYHMNLGHFDYLIEAFKYRYPEVKYIAYGKVNDYQETPLVIDKNTQRFKKDGLVINIPADKQHAADLEIAVQNNLKYELHYYKQGELVGRQVISKTDTSGINLPYHLDIPRKITEQGFDQIHILPYSRGEYFYLGYLILDE